MTQTTKARARRQRVIVDPNPDGGVLVMLTNGQVIGCRDTGHAAAVIATEARRGNVDMTITTIEWRGGLNPPAPKPAPQVVAECAKHRGADVRCAQCEMQRANNRPAQIVAECWTCRASCKAAFDSGRRCLGCETGASIRYGAAGLAEDEPFHPGRLNNADRLFEHLAGDRAIQDVVARRRQMPTTRAGTVRSGDSGPEVAQIGATTFTGGAEPSADGRDRSRQIGYLGTAGAFMCAIDRRSPAVPQEAVC